MKNGHDVNWFCFLLVLVCGLGQGVAWASIDADLNGVGTINVTGTQDLTVNNPDGKNLQIRKAEDFSIVQGDPDTRRTVNTNASTDAKHQVANIDIPEEGELLYEVTGIYVGGGGTGGGGETPTWDAEYNRGGARLVARINGEGEDDNYVFISTDRPNTATLTVHLAGVEPNTTAYEVTLTDGEGPGTVYLWPTHIELGKTGTYEWRDFDTLPLSGTAKGATHVDVASDALQDVSAPCTVLELTLSAIDPVKKGTEKSVTVTVDPAAAWNGACTFLSFDLENEKRHECVKPGCTHGGEARDTASMPDSSLGAADHVIKIKGESNGHADFKIMAFGYWWRGPGSFKILTCPCGEKPTDAYWHGMHTYFTFASFHWGDFGAVDKKNPTARNCIAYSMGLDNGYPWPGYTIGHFTALYRDECGLKEYNVEKANATVFLYAKAGVPTHAAIPHTCEEGDCSCDATSKWGSIDTSYVFCHRKNLFNFGDCPYGSIVRWYVPFDISFPATNLAVNETKTITVTVKSGTNAVQNVKLTHSIADATKLEFVKWDGGNTTDAQGQAKIQVKGKAAGQTGLTISQAAGTYKTSGRTHTEQITITGQ